MSQRTALTIAALATVAIAGCGSASTKVVAQHRTTQASTATTAPAARPVALTVMTPRHVTGSRIMLYGMITPGAEIAIQGSSSFHAVNGHWRQRVKLDQGQNGFVIDTRMAAGSPETATTITITRLLTPAERAAQHLEIQRQAERAAQRRAAQRLKAAQQAERKREAAQARALRAAAQAVANGTSTTAITGPSNPGAGYDSTYPSNFAVDFGIEFGMDFGNKYSMSANIEAAIKLEQNTPYQAIKRLNMRTIVRLALEKYAHPIG